MLAKRRIDWIDAAKGIGIVLVCLGHCIASMEMPVNKMILSFHMPLFFFLSGLTLKPIDRKNQAAYLIKRKCLTIIVPLISVGAMNCLVHMFFECVLDKKPISEFNAVYYFDNWFLLSLFISVIIGAIVISLAKFGGILLLLLLLGVFLGVDNFGVAIIEQSIVALIFSLGGYYIKSSISEHFWGGYWELKLF